MGNKKLMDSRIVLGGRPYISSREAGSISGYTSDYIARLCRTGEIESKKVGRTWYVEETSLATFMSEHEKKKEEQKKKLSEERKKEYAYSFANSEENTQEESRVLPHTHTVPVRVAVPEAAVEESDELQDLRIQATDVSEENRETALRPEPVVTEEVPSEPSQRPQEVFALGMVATAFVFCFSTVFGMFIAWNYADDVHEALYTQNSDTKPTTPSSTDFFTGMLAVSVDRASEMLATALGAVEEQSPEQSQAQALLGVPEEDHKDTDLQTDDSAKVALTPTFREDGVLVVPTNQDGELDEVVIERIKNSFSDEVEIAMRDDHTGIITPRFKTNDEEYVFVVMPLEEANEHLE